MDTTKSNPPPAWFWGILAVLLVWNLLGIVAFFQQVMLTPEQINMLPPDERAMHLNQPFWVLLAFAFAVFGGALGCVALLFRKSFARIVIWLSFVGVVVQMSYSFFISNAFEVYGPSAAVMPIMILLVAIFLIWFSGKTNVKGWLD